MIPIDIFKPNDPLPKPVEINEDGIIKIIGTVNLVSQDLPEIPKVYNEVTGHFILHHNKLKNLNGSPRIVGGGFYCEHNLLVTLDGCPDIVMGDFVCSNNPKKFTIKQVKEKCDIKGGIYV